MFLLVLADIGDENGFGIYHGVYLPSKLVGVCHDSVSIYYVNELIGPLEEPFRVFIRYFEE